MRALRQSQQGPIILIMGGSRINGYSARCLVGLSSI